MHQTFRAIPRSCARALAIGSIALLTVGASAAAVANTTRHVEHPAAGGKAGISSAAWGSVDGHAVRLYTLKSGNGMTVKITNYGGDVQSIIVPSRTGATDVSLGFPKLADYVADFTQGAKKTSWPVVGRIRRHVLRRDHRPLRQPHRQRHVQLNGKTYKLDQNNGTNMLHGGFLGWNTDVWTATPSLGSAGPSLALTATFPAGEGCLTSLSPGCTGFPAPMKATVTYTLTHSNQLQIALLGDQPVEQRLDRRQPDQPHVLQPGR